MSKYITDKYEGSISYTSVMNATEEKLLCRKHYVEIAVDYHLQEGDLGQINFFKSELKHIEKRLNLLQKEKKKMIVKNHLCEKNDSAVKNIRMWEQETDKQGRLF